MEPYEGREPYIFISYARKDLERVRPLLEALSDGGWRFWYDAGIQSGEYWTETLVEKVEGCAVFCPLFSAAFNASRFCFEETEYAYRKDKTIVPVYLEAPENMEPRPLYRLLQARQDLRPYRYADAAEFAERLTRESAFAPCKAPEWNKTGQIPGQIQWRFTEADGVLSIARNEDLPELWKFGSIPSYQYDPIHNGSTAPWMTYREKILSVEIADDIHGIGVYAFRGCANLTTARIGDSVRQIGNRAFYDCASLTDIRIPDGVIEIGAFAFAGCASLTDVRIPDSVAQIGDHAFAGCASLTDVRIPDSVTEIGDSAFAGCASLTDVRIPDSVTEIGDSAFLSCASLTDVRIPDSVTEIGAGAFWACKRLKSVEIPAGATFVNSGDWPSFSPHTLVTRRAAPDSIGPVPFHDAAGDSGL